MGSLDVTASLVLPVWFPNTGFPLSVCLIEREITSFQIGVFLVVYFCSISAPSKIPVVLRMAFR